MGGSHGIARFRVRQRRARALPKGARPLLSERGAHRRLAARARTSARARRQDLEGHHREILHSAQQLVRALNALGCNKPCVVLGDGDLRQGLASPVGGVEQVLEATAVA